MGTTPTRARRGSWGPSGTLGPEGAIAPLPLGPGVWDLDIITDGTSILDATAVDLTCDGRESDLPLLIGSTALHHHYLFITSVQIALAAQLNTANRGTISIIISATRRPD